MSDESWDQLQCWRPGSMAPLASLFLSWAMWGELDRPNSWSKPGYFLMAWWLPKLSALLGEALLFVHPPHLRVHTPWSLSMHVQTHILYLRSSRAKIYCSSFRGSYILLQRAHLFCLLVSGSYLGSWVFRISQGQRGMQVGKEKNSWVSELTGPRQTTWFNSFVE